MENAQKKSEIMDKISNSLTDMILGDAPWEKIKKEICDSIVTLDKLKGEKDDF